MGAHYRKPLVIDECLYYFADKEALDRQAVEVGSRSWFDWLDSSMNTGFHYTGDIAGEFSARKEKIKNRNGSYWYAYRKIYGKLHKKYMGKTEKLTPEKLEKTAMDMATTFEKTIGEKRRQNVR